VFASLKVGMGSGAYQLVIGLGDGVLAESSAVSIAERKTRREAPVAMLAAAHSWAAFSMDIDSGQVSTAGSLTMVDISAV